MTTRKVTPTPASAPTPGPRGADLRGQVETLRTEILAVQEQLESVDLGLVPRQELAERLEGWIDDKATAFEGNLWGQINALAGPRALPFDVGLLALPVRGAGQNMPEVVASADGGGLLAWAFGDVLKERLSTAIAAMDYPSGPPTAARPKLRRELATRLDELELREEALVMQAEASGVAIPRRVDARPEVILSLDL